MRNFIIPKMMTDMDGVCHSFKQSSYNFGVFCTRVNDDAEIYIQRIEVNEQHGDKDAHCIQYKNVSGLDVPKFLKRMDDNDVEIISQERYDAIWDRFKQAQIEMGKDLFGNL